MTDGQLSAGPGAAGQLRHGATHGAAGGPVALLTHWVMAARAPGAPAPSFGTAVGGTDSAQAVFSYREDFSQERTIWGTASGTFYESAQYASLFWGDGGYYTKVGAALEGYGSYADWDVNSDPLNYIQWQLGSLSLRESFSAGEGVPTAPDFQVPADAAVAFGMPNGWVSARMTVTLNPAEVLPATKGTAICGVKALTGDGTYPGSRVALSIVDDDGLVVATLDCTNLIGPNLIDDRTVPFFLQIDIDTEACTATLSASGTEGGPPLSPIWPLYLSVPEAHGKLVRPQWAIDGVLQGSAVSSPSLYALPVGTPIEIRVPVAMQAWNAADREVWLVSARVNGLSGAVGEQVAEGEGIVQMSATMTDGANTMSYAIVIVSPCIGTVTEVVSEGDTVGPGDSLMTIAYASASVTPTPFGTVRPPTSPQGVELSLLAWRNGVAIGEGSLVAGPGASGSLRVG
jgi:hypothetical protein